MIEIQNAGQLPDLGHVATACKNSDQTAQIVERTLTVPTVSVAAEERLLAVAHDLALLAKIGRSVALLSYIIEHCGSSNQCAINLHEAATQIGQPYSTVKTWLAGLEHEGLIRKTVLGRDGLRIELDVGRIRRTPVFARTADRLDETAEVLRAVQMTLAHVLAHAESGIRAARGAFI